MNKGNKGKYNIGIDDMELINDAILNIKSSIELYKKETGRDRYALIRTWGCQMNEHDSERLAGMLNNMGYKFTDDREKADIILFNTCCVRENAELKVQGNIGNLKPLKEQNPDLIIGVCGCMMQQKEVAEHISKKYPFVDMLFGTHNTYMFPCLLHKAMNENHTIVDIWDTEGNVIEGLPAQRTDGLKAWVTIMNGCNNFCSYCIVPYVRGRERSREPHSIIDEITELTEQGYREVTLLGQNVNSYGQDFNNGFSFSSLLIEINKIKELKRIRFMTSHPKDLSDELIFAIRDCEKVSEHLHLPIQSASNRILSKMNRYYTKEHYLSLVNKIKEEVPDIVLTTDIIIGFPGETDEDFEETFQLMKEVQFDSAFTFIYSKRSGTPASEMLEQIDDDIKHKRIYRIQEMQKKISMKKNLDMIDMTVEVLVEGTSKRNKEQLTGRTRGGKIVNFYSDQKLSGKLVEVTIKEASPYWLSGVLKKIY